MSHATLCPVKSVGALSGLKLCNLASVRMGSEWYPEYFNKKAAAKATKVAKVASLSRVTSMECGFVHLVYTGSLYAIDWKPVCVSSWSHTSSSLFSLNFLIVEMWCHTAHCLFYRVFSTTEFEWAQKLRSRRVRFIPGLQKGGNSPGFAEKKVSSTGCCFNMF